MSKLFQLLTISIVLAIISFTVCDSQKEMPPEEFKEKEMEKYEPMEKGEEYHHFDRKSPRPERKGKPQQRPHPRYRPHPQPRRQEHYGYGRPEHDQKHRRRPRNQKLKYLLCFLLGVIAGIPVFYLIVRIYNKCYLKRQRQFYDNVKAMMQSQDVSQQNIYQTLLGNQDDQLAFPKKEYPEPKPAQDMNKSSIERGQYLFV